MSIEANKALVRRYLHMYSSGDVHIADDILATDFIDHSHPDLPPGPEPVKRMVADVHAALSHAETTVEDMIGEDNVIAFRFTLRGRHTGPFAGIPPTGRMVALTGIDFIRISGGQLAELWSSQDTLSWALQLGIVEWAVRQASTETER